MQAASIGKMFTVSQKAEICSFFMSKLHTLRSGEFCSFNVAPIELIMLPDNRNETQTTVLCFLVVRVCLAITFVTASKGTLTLRDFTNFIEPQCS